MGTKIPADAVFSENDHNVIGHNGNANNGFGSLRDNRVTRNGQNPDWLISRTYENGYSICNVENVRLTMISQEAVFKKQVQDLHRIYHRQRDLMKEITMRDGNKTPVLKHFEPSSNGGDRWLSLGVGLRSNQLEPLPVNCNHFLQNLELGGNGRAAKEKCAESLDPGNCKAGLPLFIKNTLHNGETSKEVEHPYFMSLDSLRNCSEKFFTKSKTESSTQKLDMSAPMDVNEIKKDQGDAKNQFKTMDLPDESSMSYQVDLNLSLSTPSLSTAVVKIATAETGLEAPAVERDESVAQALISISKMGNDSRNLTEAKSTDSLYRFAELILSHSVNSANESGEDSVPEGMDYFEYMTLKLEDVKDEPPSRKSSTVLNFKRKEKMGQDSTKCKGPRKRTRQQKNFKRDVLPGIATLSRQDLKEDLKTFEKIRKGKGHSSKSKNSEKKGIGRKSTSPGSAVALPELRPVDGCLVGWGMKKTRLPRR